MLGASLKTLGTGIFITLMDSELHKFATWIDFVGPDYVPYFNADLKAQFEAVNASSIAAEDRNQWTADNEALTMWIRG